MATRVSAGVYVNERDLSQYAPLLGISRLALVGAATKGPLDTPIEITNEADLVRKFGAPVLTDYGLHAAIRFLRKGNNLVYLRVADRTEAAKADAKLYGGERAEGSIEFDSATNPTDVETITIDDGLDTLDYGTLVGAFQVGERVVGGTSSAVGLVVTDDGSTMKVMTLSGTFVAETITGQTSGATAVVATVTASVGVVFEFDDGGGITGDVAVLIGATAFDTMANLIAAINGSTLEITATDASTSVLPKCTLLHASLGAGGNQAIAESGAAITVTGMAGGTNLGTELLTIFAKSEGTWGNSVQVEIRQSQQLGAAVNDRDLLVLASPEPGSPVQVVERFNQFSLDPDSDRFLEQMLTEGIVGEVGASEYITADVYPAGGTSTVDAGVVTTGTFTLGSLGNTQGADGIASMVAADVIGTVSGQKPTGLKALRNPERVEFNLIAVPAWTDIAVISEVEDLCDNRGDCLALIDAPFGLTRDNVIAWHNGTSTGIPNAPTQPLDNNRMTLNWAWIKDYDPYSKQNIWLPPCGFVAANVAQSDRETYPWFPYAGHNRGILDGRAVEYSPDQDDRDLLCPVNGQNAVNPIVDFEGQGLTLFGNKTLQRQASALTSVHVRRMLLYAEKLIATAVKYLVFEPNEPVTWRRFTLLVNPILENIASNRGLEEFQVICDASTNPPEQRNNKTMRAKLYMTPVLAAERIELDFTVFAAGAEFSEAA